VDDHPLNTTDMLAASRTHLANERTFAAWVRTGLSVAAAGIAVAKAPASPRAHTAKLALGALFILLGSVMIVFGGIRYGRVANDLRAAGSPPVRLSGQLVYLIMALLAILVLMTFVVLA
jgi:putative membrane protein